MAEVKIDPAVVAAASAPDAPAPAKAPAKAKAPASKRASNGKRDVLADFKIAPARKVQYEPREGSGHVDAPEISDSATVHRGKRVRDGLPCFYVQDGSAQPFALPLSCVSALIAGGLVTVEELTEILA